MTKLGHTNPAYLYAKFFYYCLDSAPHEPNLEDQVHELDSGHQLLLQLLFIIVSKQNRIYSYFMI